MIIIILIMIRITMIIIMTINIITILHVLTIIISCVIIIHFTIIIIVIFITTAIPRLRWERQDTMTDWVPVDPRSKPHAHPRRIHTKGKRS